MIPLEIRILIRIKICNICFDLLTSIIIFFCCINHDRIEFINMSKIYLSIWYNSIAFEVYIKQRSYLTNEGLLLCIVEVFSFLYYLLALIIAQWKLYYLHRSLGPWPGIVAPPGMYCAHSDRLCRLVFAKLWTGSIQSGHQIEFIISCYYSKNVSWPTDGTC